MIHKFSQGDLYFLLDINSGSIHVVDEIIYKILDYYPEKEKEEVLEILSGKFKVEELNIAFDEIKELRKNGQLFTEDTYVYSPAFVNRKPVVKAMCLHVAHDCNLRCKYCFASQGDFEGTRSLMSAEVGKKSLLYLVQNSGTRKNLEVDFFGGEPLMNFEVVKELVDYGRSLEKEYNKNFRYTITTNGTLLTDEINDYINENMDNVVLSIDGRKEVNDTMRYFVNEKGTYDNIMPKFKSLVSKRGDKTYYVRGTFTKYNTDFSKDVIHMANNGFRLTSIEPVVTEAKYDYALDESDLPKIFSEYDKLAEEIINRHGTEKEFEFFHFMNDLTQGPCIIKRVSGCGAGSEYLAISPEGDIYPCHQFVGDEDFKMGNILKNNLDDSLTKQFKDANVYTKEKCKECWAKFYCSGGCHANAYNFNGDVNKPYELGCEMEKKRLECSIYIKAKTLLGGE
ncbi:thioether cross-link-forming SCIFF peptide maturase [Helicovermis profundi]|uniref:Thioether cross-link-forming SCIFF peptide maturase n=1 Tax=Helicovermis profundi TaxID=3065157 RepID=A0AAU9ERN5_9FIRM|nr:thioether cross-link-forming SCIFF peptide maturase [Clostridia bacterium S502]